MKEKTCKKVRLVYGWLLSAMTVILGALFIWQTLDIYFTGTAADYTGTYIFTREIVAERLLKISPAIWLWLIMAVVGFVLWETFPVKDKRSKPDVRYTLHRLKKRVPATVNAELSEQFNLVSREERIIKLLWLFVGLICAAGAIYGLVYLCIPTHFPKVDVTAEMLNMVKNIMPWALFAFVVACVVAVYEGRSAKKQLDCVKKLAAGNKPCENKRGAIYQKLNATAFGKVFCKLYDKVYFVVHHKYFLTGVRIGVGCFAVAFIIAGAFNGSMHDVLVKAINICTECIGLG